MKYKIKRYEIKQLDTAEKGDYYTLQLKKTGRHFKITEELKKVIPLLDGTRDIPKIVKDLQVKEKIKTNKDEIEWLIKEHLEPLGIFEGSADTKKREPFKMWFHWSLIKGERLEGIAKPFIIFFNKTIFIIFLAFFFVTNGYLLATKQFFLKTGVSGLKIIHLPLLIFLLIFSILFHEFGHAVSAFKFGVKPRSLGIGLYIFEPVVFIDMSEAWILKRKQRVVTDLAGIYFQIILTIIISLWMVIFGFNYTLFLFNVANIFIALVNFDPFSRLDGYWALTDLVGISNAHEKALTYLNSLFFQKLLKRKTDFRMPNLKANARKFFIGYSLIYSASIIFLMGSGIIYSFTSLKVSLTKKNYGLMSSALSHQQWSDFGKYLFSFIVGQLIPLLFLVFITFRLVKYIKRLVTKKAASI